MQLIILVTIITWSFNGDYQHTPSYQLVSSAEDAAIKVYEDSPPPWKVEPDHKEYHLYKVDFSKGIITEIALPSVEFKTANNKEENSNSQPTNAKSVEDSASGK